MENSILQTAANEARGLAIDAISARASGHLGLPLGCAEIGAVLFGEILNFDPKRPDWLNRDRFILSAGHGSMFIYAWLHIAGYNLSIEDLKNFRVMHSKTPGHPEFGETEGVEITSGPLGQGVGNAVGMAISEKMAEARFNTENSQIFGHKIWCLAGDGCLQEGVSAEACSLAGTLKLDNLIIIYDSNDITLDAPESKSSTEDVGMRFKAYGFEVIKAENGNDIDCVRKALKKADKSKSGKPKIVIFKTLIGKGIPEIEGKSTAHGEGGAKYKDAARKALGLPEEGFYVSEGTYEFFKKRAAKGKRLASKWEKLFKAWKSENSQKAEILEKCLTKSPSASAEELMKLVPVSEETKAVATRSSGGDILNAMASAIPYVITGAADLFGSTKNYLKNMGDFSAEDRLGRNIWYGIREHAMGAITNGIAYHGLFTPSCATFLTFAGYMTGAVRISALAGLNVQFIYTHDSIGVGLDGPTHQPVETAAMLRCIPNLNVVRPADAEECVGAFAFALSNKKSPTALLLSRQNLPPQNSVPALERRMGVLKGAYIAKREEGSLEKIVLASGSELQFAMNYAKDKTGVRVVSVPCMEIFDSQPQEYKDEILPASCVNRIAIEAGSSLPWFKYAKKVVGTDTFGFSAEESELYEYFKINEGSLED